MIGNLRNQELLDLVDAQNNIIGAITRQSAHSSPKFIHKEAAVVLYNDHDEILIHQRGLTKSLHPGSWQLTAAGHIKMGEKDEEAAYRELQEEVNIKTKLEFVTQQLAQNETESRLFSLFIGEVTGRPGFITDHYEVMNLLWLSIDEVHEFAKKNPFGLGELSHDNILIANDYYRNKQ